MAGFYLGNFWINEILDAVIQNKENDAIMATLTELSNATINVSSDVQEKTDKKGNIVKRKYRSKTAEFTATNAFLSTDAMNVGSGSSIDNLSEDNTKILTVIAMVAAGGSIKLVNFVEGTAHVQGLYKGGANDPIEYTLGTTASASERTFAIASDGTLTVPAAGEGAPIQYVVVYDQDATSGKVLYNYSDKFPETVKLTLLCEYETPCDGPASCYVYIPSFQPSPEVELAFDAENQTMDFNGSVLTDMCGTEKLLYMIYFPATGETVFPDQFNITLSSIDPTTSVFNTEVSDIQDGLTVNGNKITGTLKYLDGGDIVDTWGAGNFMAIQFSDIPATATSIKVGMDPSQSSGLVELIDDPDKNGVFKVTNKDTQVFKVVITDGTDTTTKIYDLSGLTIQSA